jgi:hypothetical protein
MQALSQLSYSPEPTYRSGYVEVSLAYAAQPPAESIRAIARSIS